MCMPANTYAGASILFPSEAFDPNATLIATAEEKATGLYGVATMFVAELELLAHAPHATADFSSLRTGIAAGSSVPSTLMRKLHGKLNLTGLTICYGMTETSPVSCMTGPADPMEKRVGSVGRVMPHTEVKVVDVSDKKTVLPIGVKGELAVSGYLLMKGYWGDETKTREAMIQDETGKTWMLTGDEAEMDADGFVKITGRIKDLIIRGGENIHPLEVEDCLFAHEFVAQASVVGLPDDKYGECVAAFVVVHEDVKTDEDTGIAEGQKMLRKSDVRDWVKSRLSGHLVPKYVFWVREYPKTASGKIQKFKLRDTGIELVREGKGV
jgi:acyl-CoA synthetase (AMP-forming)/AMP-acid ligase II